MSRRERFITVVDDKDSWDDLGIEFVSEEDLDTVNERGKLERQGEVIPDPDKGESHGNTT